MRRNCKVEATMHKRILTLGILILLTYSIIIPIILGSNIAITNTTDKLLNQFNNGNILFVGGIGPNNYTSIQDAIDNSSDGNTVFVFDDSSPYYENLDMNKSINLIGENRETTIIDSGINKIVLNITKNFLNFSGFTLTNNASYWLGYYGIYLRSDCNHIFNNIINLSDGIGIFLNSNNNVISSNIISNSFTGILLHNCCNNTVSGNIISKNNWGIELGLSTDNIISGNTISSSVWRGVSLHGWSHKNIITKNIIISNNWSGISLILCNQNIISNNNIENNENSIGLLDSHFNKIKNNNIIGNKLDPHFKDSIANQWKGNYWGRNRNLPKFIFGSLVLLEPPAHVPGLFIKIPWINVDLFPAKGPYNIPRFAI